jgi:hypothetical protein
VNRGKKEDQGLAASNLHLVPFSSELQQFATQMVHVASCTA